MKKILNTVRTFIMRAICRTICEYEVLALVFLSISGIVMFLQSYQLALLLCFISNLFLWITIVHKDNKNEN
jgi:ABC-type bacteriocin/lantibiotic exporter with double-glycine peptidase domain